LEEERAGLHQNAQPVEEELLLGVVRVLGVGGAHHGNEKIDQQHLRDHDVRPQQAHAEGGRHGLDVFNVVLSDGRPKRYRERSAQRCPRLCVVTSWTMLVTMIKSTPN
jgi:hypothetical protein